VISTKPLSLALVIATCALGCHDTKSPPPTPSPPKGVTPAQVTVSSSAFGPGAKIPTDYTCDGSNDRSPQLAWSALTDTTRSIALVVDDPDAPSGTFTHWIAWNLAPETRMLADGANAGTANGVSGTNDFGRVGYSGPCPPKGKLHHYHFKLFGLDAASLPLKADAKRADLDAAMSGHVVAQGDLVGTFEH
jgi:Raf kinase inhibitor-like YbhB/YbcL family protein